MKSPGDPRDVATSGVVAEFLGYIISLPAWGWIDQIKNVILLAGGAERKIVR
jgi:hypothetical protein